MHALKKMKTFHFTVAIDNFSELSEELEDAIFECGCDDALLSVVGGVCMLEFDREGYSLFDAIASAISDLSNSKIPLQLGSIGPGDVVSQAEFARRLNISREAVRKMFLRNIKAHTSFPKPRSIDLQMNSFYWSFHEVLHWLVCESPKKPKAVSEQIKETDLDYYLFIKEYNMRLSAKPKESGQSRFKHVSKALNLKTTLVK
jgi:hypothetical protein